MIPLIPYVIMLLVISTIAMLFISRVIHRQVELFRYKIIDKKIRHFRYALFALSLTIAIAGLIPIAINVLTLFNDVGRPPMVQPISFIYSLSVHLQTLLLSYLLFRIYRLADNEEKITEYTQSRLNDNERGKHGN